MHVLCIFSTNLTLGIRTKDLHSMVRSRKPVVIPIESPNPKPCPQTESSRTATARLTDSWEGIMYFVVLKSFLTSKLLMSDHAELSPTKFI